MKYYALIREQKILGVGQCYCTSDDCICIEITEEQYNLIQEKGNNYYIYQNDELVLNPNYEDEEAQKERERIDHLSLTKREVFLAIYKDKQITPDMIRSMLTSDEAKIEFDYANDYFRGNPLIGALGEALGYTPSQLDHLFEYGEIPQDENTIN